MGNSTGLNLPKDLLGKLNLAQGDWLYVTENADGSVGLSAYDPTFEKGMKVAEKGDEDLTECPGGTGEMSTAREIA